MKYRIQAVTEDLPKVRLLSASREEKYNKVKETSNERWRISEVMTRNLQFSKQASWIKMKQ